MKLKAQGTLVVTRKPEDSSLESDSGSENTKSTKQAAKVRSVILGPHGFHVAATWPSWLCGITTADIIWNHHAAGFLDTLGLFLHTHGSRFEPQSYDSFDLYVQVAVCLPPIPVMGSRHLKNGIRASPPRPADTLRTV